MFISFEGLDFSGKSTQIKKLIETLDRQKKSNIVFREPGGTPLCEDIRNLILTHKHSTITPETELLLFAASRAQLIEEKIRPALDNYDLVIADRFYDSTTVYQGFGRHLPVEFIKQLNSFATKGLQPDLTFFIDLPVEMTFQRRKEAGRSEDRMEQAGRAFFDRVREGYLELATKEPRIITLDGTQRVEDLHLQILRTLKLIE